MPDNSYLDVKPFKSNKIPTTKFDFTSGRKIIIPNIIG